jgi:iron complex transport system ATP-binding protein
MSLRAENLTVRLGDRKILNEVSFICKSGEITAIVGENGAGKSTLMNCLSGILNFEGDIHLNGRSVKGMSIAQQAQYRAVLPQHSTLNFPLDVREIVRLALSLSTLSNDDQEAIIHDSLVLVDGLQFIDRGYLNLSGGEKQRVQIARVLAQLRAYDHEESRFLLLDEPTSALDLKHQYATLKMLRELCCLTSARDLGALVILHDLNLASLYCDKVLLLKDGKLIKHDTPTVVFEGHRINDTFGVDVFIGTHPDTNQPYLIPRI